MIVVTPRRMKLMMMYWYHSIYLSIPLVMSAGSHIVSFLDYMNIWHKYNLHEDYVLCIISRSTGQKSGSFKFLWLGQGWGVVIVEDQWSTIFSCDQAALWMVQSVCPSVRPSVRHTFLTMFPSSNHHEIFRSYYQWQKWRPCKRSRSEVKGQGHRGHNPT